MPPQLESPPGVRDGLRHGIRRGHVVAWAAVALLSLLATLPGLSGSWVHDDHHMLDNARYDGLEDTVAVLWQHSGLYARDADAPAEHVGKQGATTGTYRPATMLSLVMTHVLSPAAWLHHLVGWSLHLLTALLLYLALLRRYPDVGGGWVHWALAALFFLHPVGVESYVWINGRSDLMAGLWLVALLLLLSSPREVSPTRALAIFGIAVLGSSSKETFVPAALLASASFAFPVGAQPQSLRDVFRAAWPRSLPVAGAVGVYALARFAVLPSSTGESLAHGGNPLAEAGVWLFLPKLGAISSHALLSMRAATMQSLGWDMMRGLSPGEWLGGGLALVGLGALLRRRDWAGLTLVAAAATCLAPVVLVVFAIWLGLDRYLYMPLILVLFAAAPYVIELATKLAQRLPRVLPFALAVILALAAFNTSIASRAYAGQDTWLWTLMQERPEDPTVVALVAAEVGQPRARMLMERFPPPPWPKSVIVPLIAHASAGGLTALAGQAAEYGVTHYPQDALIAGHALRMRYQAGRREEALELLPRIAGDAYVCAAMAEQLQAWARQSAGPQRERLLAAKNELRCTSGAAEGGSGD